MRDHPFLETPFEFWQRLRELDPYLGLAVAVAITHLPEDFDAGTCTFVTRVGVELQRLSDRPEVPQLYGTLLRYWATSLVVCVEFTRMHDCYRIAARRAGFSVDPRPDMTGSVAALNRLNGRSDADARAAEERGKLRDATEGARIGDFIVHAKQELRITEVLPESVRASHGGTWLLGASGEATYEGGWVLEATGLRAETEGRTAPIYGRLAELVGRPGMFCMDGEGGPVHVQIPCRVFRPLHVHYP